MYNNYIYIAVMALVSYTIRILPLTLIRKPIKNQFIQSFLYYVPYVTLSVMTFPAIVHATQSPVSGALALVVGIAAAWFGASLFQVSVACCAVVFVIELFLSPGRPVLYVLLFCFCFSEMINADRSRRQCNLEGVFFPCRCFSFFAADSVRMFRIVVVLRIFGVQCFGLNKFRILFEFQFDFL